MVTFNATNNTSNSFIASQLTEDYPGDNEPFTANGNIVVIGSGQMQLYAEDGKLLKSVSSPYVYGDDWIRAMISLKDDFLIASVNSPQQSNTSTSTVKAFDGTTLSEKTSKELVKKLANFENMDNGQLLNAAPVDENTIMALYTSGKKPMLFSRKLEYITQPESSSEDTAKKIAGLVASQAMVFIASSHIQKGKIMLI